MCILVSLHIHIIGQTLHAILKLVNIDDEFEGFTFTTNQLEGPRKINGKWCTILLGNGGSVQKKIIQILVFIKSIEKGKPTVLMSL